jgi:hypothetical protein
MHPLSLEAIGLNDEGPQCNPLRHGRNPLAQPKLRVIPEGEPLYFDHPKVSEKISIDGTSENQPVIVPKLT